MTDAIGCSAAWAEPVFRESVLVSARSRSERGEWVEVAQSGMGRDRFFPQGLVLV